MKLSIRHFFIFSFLLELFLFAFTLFLAIGVALNIIAKIPAKQAIATEGGFSVWTFLILFIIATVILLLILKYFKNPWIIKGLFYLAVFEGLLIFCRAYFDWPDFLYILAFFLIVWLFYRNVLAHNFVIILTISAISAVFGLNLMPSAAVLVLLILAVYDYWAVYKTKHMVKMFKSMAEAKIHFALIIPQNFHGLFKKMKDVSPDTEFMFLGTGDLVLPAILVVSSLKISYLTSLTTLLGAVCGFIFLYILFISQKKRAPMPGLPPIVSGTLIGFLVSFLI